MLARQPDGPRITPYLAYQTEMAWRQDDARRAALAGIRTEGDLLRLQGELRAKLLRMLGGLPSTRTPLNAQVTGRIQMTGFHIEKVVFESLPGIFVTALVYVPDDGAAAPSGGAGGVGPLGQRQGPLPGPVPAAGGARVRRDQLGSRGPGRAQPVLGRSAKRSRYNLVCGEHAVLGNLAYLAGTNLARWEVWDGMRALDYLLTRPEVDPARISITGTSGGGFQAAIIAALDSRIRVAAPSCFITALPMRMANRIFEDPDSDPEQDAYRMIADGVDHAGLLLLMYPRPVFVAAAVLDFFPIEGTRRTFREVAAVYRRFGHPDRIAMHEGYHKHEFSVENQAAAFTFLDRFNGMPAQPGLATTTELDDRGAALHAHRPGAARSRGRQDIDGRDPRLLPRPRQHTGDTPSSCVFWTRLPGHRALASRAVRGFGLRKAADPVGGGRHALPSMAFPSTSTCCITAAVSRCRCSTCTRRAPVVGGCCCGSATVERPDVHDWSAMQQYIADGYDVVSFDGRASGETRMRYTAMSIDDPSLAQQDFDRAYTSPLSGVLANYVYNSLLTGRPYLLQMIEDVEIAARFARIRLNATDISITATGDAYTLAHDAADVLPGLRLLPDDNGHVLSWAQLVKDKQEVWPIQYILPGGAYLR